MYVVGIAASAFVIAAIADNEISPVVANSAHSVLLFLLPLLLSEGVHFFLAELRSVRRLVLVPSGVRFTFAEMRFVHQEAVFFVIIEPVVLVVADVIVEEVAGGVVSGRGGLFDAAEFDLPVAAPPSRNVVGALGGET